ncbi:hypothetical protein [Anaerobaca lacustris]|uniref:SRPBCC family protein n=1 Tax=Anaerobaca lacustris TaxID=3044600 RepID=A0AAW6TV62_9BACT|nr:hypothetical protein [Sedimentisphaerales bacterium M17dextr]
MNDSSIAENPAQSNGGRPDSGHGVRRRRRRFRVRVAIALLLGLCGLAVVRQLTHVPPSPDGRYGWTLHFPGPSPGATFKTAPGDDIRRLLDFLLIDAGADWHGALQETGTIQIELSHVSAAPLGVRLLWRFLGPEGTPAPDKMGRTLLTVQVRVPSTGRPGYEIVRLGPQGTETVIGVFDEYRKAEDAILDNLADVMEAVQAKAGGWRIG